MSYLLDSNTLLRLADLKSPERSTVVSAIRRLRLRGERLVYTPQILSEFWNVCTRPTTARGGLQLSIDQTERKVRLIEKYFTLLPDNASTHLEWRKLVYSLKISGVQVHDAKLVSSMMVHNVQNLITYNGKDFRRFGSINVLLPADA